VIGPPATPLRLLAGQQRLQPGPFLVGQIVSIEHAGGLPHLPVKIRGTRSSGRRTGNSRSRRGGSGGTPSTTVAASHLAPQLPVDPAVVRWGARHRGRRRRREQCPLQCGVIQPVGQRPAPRPAWPGVGSGAPWTARFAPTRRSADRSARPHGPAASPLRSLVCCRREDKTDARDDAGIIVDQTRTRCNLHHAYGRSARRVTRAVPPAN
jgi:hypothetical protein